MMKHRCNLMFVYLQGGPLAGASRMVYTLVTALSDTHNISLLVNSGSDLYQKLREHKNLKVYPILVRNYLELVTTMPRLVSLVNQIITNDNIHIVWTPNLEHFLLFSWVRIRGVCLLANHYGLRQGIMSKVLYMYEYLLADAMIYEYYAQPQAIFFAKRFISSPKNYIIYTGYDFSRFPAIKLPIRHTGLLKLGTAASIRKGKGILEIIQVIRELRDRGLLVCDLTIIGDIPNEKHIGYLEKVKKEIVRRNLNSIVHITGWVEHDQVLRLLQELHVFIFMSYSEGLSGALREAAALGIPIIATDVGGAREIVVDGYNGILIAPGDKEGLIRAILRINNDYEAFATNGREHAKTIRERFTVEGFVNGYLKLIDDICEER